jgi:hypothetical protein
MAESKYDHDQIVNLKQGEGFLKIDFSSKLWAHIHKEQICHAAAGIASNHVFLLYMLFPDASTKLAFPALDIDAIIKSHNPSIEGGIVSFFIDIFSADTEQDSDKVCCEESAAYNYINDLFPWVVTIKRSTDNAAAYHCSSAVQRMVYCLLGDEVLQTSSSNAGGSLYITFYRYIFKLLHFYVGTLSGSSDVAKAMESSASSVDDDAMLTDDCIAPPRISCTAIHFKAEGEGKDRVDSEGSFLKKILRRRCNQGHDLMSALEMCQACNLRPDEWSVYVMSDYKKSAVAQFDSCPIPGISDFHLIEKEYADSTRRVVTGVRAYKVSGYGEGVFFSLAYLAGLQKTVHPEQAESLLSPGQPARLFVPPPAKVSMFDSLLPSADGSANVLSNARTIDVKAISTHEGSKAAVAKKLEDRFRKETEKSLEISRHNAVDDSSFVTARGGVTSFICKAHPMCGLVFSTQTGLDKHLNSVGVHERLPSKPTGDKLARFIEIVHSVLRGSSDYYAAGSVLQRGDQHASKSGNTRSSAATEAYAQSSSLTTRRSNWTVTVSGLPSDVLSPREFRQISIAGRIPVINELFDLIPGGTLYLSLKVYPGMIFDKFVRDVDGSYTLVLIRPAPRPYFHGWAIGGHDPCQNFNGLASLTLDTPRRAESTKFLTDIFNEDQKVRPYDAMIRHRVTNLIYFVLRSVV